MKWFRNTHEIIELAKENAELKNGIDNILLSISGFKNGRRHISMKGDNEEISFILRWLDELFVNIAKSDNYDTSEGESEGVDGEKVNEFSE